MKKLLHIQLLCKMSGVQKISYEILKNIGAEYEKYIIFSSEECTGDKNDVIEKFEGIGVKIIFVDDLVRELNIKKDIIALKKIYKICKTEQFDIVHTHSSKTGVLGRIAATFAGVPNVIHTVHGVSFTKFTPKLKWIAYFIFEMIATIFCNKIVLVNKYYRKYFGYCSRKVQCIYNAIDYNELQLESNDEEKNDTVINLLFVGRLDRQKDPLTMLQAFKRANIENTKLIIVGDGELTEECENYVINNRMDKNVMFMGWCTNIARFYQNADIFVSSSIYEAFGLTFLEAGYFKIPVVATNVEGIPEVVVDGKTGLLSEPRDFIGMAENMKKLCADAELRKKMGDEGYHYVTNRFSIEKMVEEYQKVYEER